jgi:hypothetical protein
MYMKKEHRKKRKEEKKETRTHGMNWAGSRFRPIHRSGLKSPMVASHSGTWFWVWPSMSMTRWPAGMR